MVLPEEGWRFPAGAPEQPWRNYTVRSHRPQTGEIDVDVLLHEPRGPACTVASQCQLGWSVGYAGPRVDYAPIQDVDWLLLVGDETALQRSRRRHPRGDVAVDAGARADRGRRPEDELTLQPHHRVQWVHRERAPAGVSTALCDALRALELPDGPGRPGARRSRRSPGNCVPCCATNGACRARTLGPGGTGCGRATGSTTRSDGRGSGQIAPLDCATGRLTRPLQPLWTPRFLNVPGGCVHVPGQ